MENLEPSRSPTPRPSSELDRLVAAFERDGFVLLPGLFPRELVQRWAEAFRPLLDHHLSHHADPSFRGPARYYVTLPFRAPFADPAVFENEKILALMEKIAGKDFTMCQLATDTPLRGSDYQEVHADAPPLFPGLADTPSFQLAVNFPLCDVTAENGPLEITRGTHRTPKEETLARVRSGEIPLEPIHMRMGDVLVRDVRGLHRGTPNHTEVPRPMVVVGYSRKWLLRPEVNIRIPRAEWEKLSPRARHLLRFNPIVENDEAEPKAETYKSFAY